jgi:hypothetical protein
MKLIDYCFYRIYSFYKQKKDSTPIFMGCGVLAITLFLTLLSLETIITAIARIELKINKLTIVIFLFLVIAFLGKRYSNNQVIKLLEEKYGSEEDSKKRRHALYIFLYILVVLLTPMVYGYLKHNLKMDI